MAPQLAITAIFFLWPASEALRYSLQKRDPIGISSTFVGLDSFKRLFSDGYCLAAFWTTLAFSGLVIVFGMGLSLLLAALVDYVICLKKLYQNLLLPYVVTPVMVAVLQRAFVRGLVESDK